MFQTPPSKKMVSTRSTTRHESQVKDKVQPQNKTECSEVNLKVMDAGIPGTSAESIKVDEKILTVPSQTSKSFKTRKSSSSSSAILAQKKKLEMEAAKEKARIQLELIDKKLAADLAAVEHKYSPHASETDDSQGDGKDIEQWLERSHHELEKQKASDHGTHKGLLFPPPDVDGTNGPVQQLASALRDLVASTASTSHNANLLSRISTPKELPLFFGDPMEWLSFKNAYEESTKICNFSEKENLWRLRKCLRGSAKEAVSALLISTTSPDVVISTLELQYGNPDVIISRILNDVKKLNPLPQEYYKDIVTFSVKIKNYVASVRELKREEYLHGVGVVNIVLSKLPTVLLSKWADYSYPLITERKKARLDILSEFLSAEAIKISTCSASLINVRWDNKRKYSENNNSSQSQTVLLQTEQSEQKCRFCRESSFHKLIDCKKFKRSLRKDRWSFVKRVGICFKCLLAQHDRQTCPAAACDVDGCGELHHRLLHYPTSSRQNTGTAATTTPQQATVTPPPATTETETTVENINHINTAQNCSVLLKVVPIVINGPNGNFQCSALLDDGSTVSMISARLATRAGLRGRKLSMRVRGAWDNTELLCDTELVDLNLSNKQGDKYNISVRSVNELSLPKQDLTLVKCENYKYLRKLSGELSSGLTKPEVLIGQDNYHLLKPLEVIVSEAREPCATRTPLGWCLHGKVPHAPTPYPAHENHSTQVLSTDKVSPFHYDVTLLKQYPAATKTMSETESETYLPSQSHLKHPPLESATLVAKPESATTPTCATLPSIPKAIPTRTGYMNLQMHIFCDAFTKSSCAVACSQRRIDNRFQTRVAFTSSKCRAAGMKPIHAPLELHPAVLVVPVNKECKLKYLTIVNMQNYDLPVPEPTKFSSWLRLLRATSRLLTFVDKALEAVNWKFDPRQRTYNLNDDVMEKAERLLLRYSQAQSFREEITLLRSSADLPTTSKLLALSPYLDDHGVLRAAGRIDAVADVLPDVKRPAIIDEQNYITRLIVRHYHVNAAHGNQEMVVNENKQKYWVIRSRSTVKNKNVIKCKLKKCKQEIPRIGDLPYGDARMAHHQRPANTALRRIPAQRGSPQQLFSYNGFNLRGAHAELKKSIQDLDENDLTNEAWNHGTKWTVIPPASPHRGGAWKRLIRNVKTSLPLVHTERLLRDQKLNQDQRPSEMGNLVHLVDPYGPRSKWPKGFIQDVYPEINKIMNEVLTQSAARVAWTPVSG